MIVGTDPVSATVSTDESGSIIDAIQLTGNETYFIASQHQTTRAVYYQGKPELPPLVSGRFFTSEECLSNQKLAVIGKNQTEKTWQDTDSKKTYIDLMDNTYEVIGVVGLSTASTIDELAFVNFGSLSSDQQKSGRFYLDGASEKPKEYYSQIVNKADKLGISGLHEIDMPSTSTDIIAGGVFMANILQIVIFSFLVGASICILVFFLLSNRQKISVYLLNGYPYTFTTTKIFRPCLISGLGGIAAAGLSLVVLGKINFFALPPYTIYMDTIYYLLLAIIVLILWTIPLFILIRRFNVAESLR
jgi:putative ABC transport system permease protein